MTYSSVMQKLAPMPSDDELQRMFSLASYLHPERLVALCVTLDACDWIPTIAERQSRRAQSSGAYKLRLPQSSIHRFAVYAASQSWEIDQERSKPKKKVHYQPTNDDFLVRYVEFLVWTTMERPSAHAAVAIGHYLYAYQLNEIAAVAPDCFREDNIRRINGYVAARLNDRFRGSSNYKSELPRRVPTDHECLVVNQALEVLAPRYSLPAAPVDPSQSILEKYYSANSRCSELERIRCILHPRFGGFQRLINEYNSSLRSRSSELLPDPNLSRRIPNFNDKVLVFPESRLEFSSNFERVVDELTATEITAIKHGRKSKA